MTSASLDRLQRSFAALAPRLETITSRFYERLFELRPDTRSLFQIDMQLQRRHLAAALAMIVRNLRMLDALEQPLRELGARHARIGVLVEHYPAVVDAMLSALSEGLGSGWDADLAADWVGLLNRITAHMTSGARDL